MDNAKHKIANSIIFFLKKNTPIEKKKKPKNNQ